MSLLEVKAEASRVPGIGKELMSSQSWQLDMCQWYILPAVFLAASWSGGFSGLNSVLCLFLRFTVKNQPLLLGWGLTEYFLPVFQPLVTVHYQLSCSCPVISGTLFEELSSNSTHYLGYPPHILGGALLLLGPDMSLCLMTLLGDAFP